MTFIEAYHVGFVVADLDATMSEFSDLLGVSWARPQRRDFTPVGPDGPVPTTFRFTYSTPLSGSALIELIEGPEGSPWWPGEGVPAAFHHIGFWADDLPAEVAALHERGAPLEVTVPDAEGAPRGFAYHRLAHGPRIELVDAARRPAFQRWLAGGSFPQG